MLKLGIIGTNWITEQFIDAVLETKEWQLTSIYSRTLPKAKAFAEKFTDKAEYFTELDKFFAEGNFEVVYIASPNSLHFEQSRAAILAGKHVIVEKPACSNPQEMRQIIKLLRQNRGVCYFEAARHLHERNFKMLKQQIKEMDVIQGASLTYMKYSSRYESFLAGNEPNIFSPHFSGGALQDLGVYLVYNAVSWFGVPDEVNYYPTKLRNGIDGKGTAVLRYTDYQVVLTCGKTANSYLTSEVYGLKETLIMDNAAELKKITLLDGQGNQRDLTQEVDRNPMLSEVQDFTSVLKDPTSLDSKQQMDDWLAIAIQVNRVLYDLRMSADLYFDADSKHLV
ncbi:Gfo/Idh/MocA family protein [Liquorilactobacillus capillatus]|uniref:Oxidoreductase n=1 Tax=Liquorilactobacillus capillatus DSM 19910 TaxID=1423731 RepID=A0A0R1M5F2_9LACO|nr:Gfo/Idh/MocA family oxidoreductase [Liquorilactobacillus capillatus]KRL00274.1 oxidoreductase [Liquorilactobacillus capillatus DSM 19910]